MLPVSDIEKFSMFDEFIINGVRFRVEAIDYRNKWMRLVIW